MAKKDEYYLQGAVYHGAMTQSGNRLARDMFKKALDADDDFARAYGFLSYTQLIAYLQEWRDPKHREDDDATITEAHKNAHKAFDLDPDDYEVLWSWGAANVFLQNLDEGIDAYDKAIAIAEKKGTRENVSTLIVERADAFMFQGGKSEVEKAIKHVTDEIAAAEKENFEFRKTHLWTLGWAYYELAFYDRDKDPKKDEAKQKEYAQKALDALLQFRNPGPLILKNIIAIYCLLGWKDVAKQQAKQLRPLLPDDYTVGNEAKWPYEDCRDERLRRFQDHLKQAGLP